jgi:hypothetical protein
MICQIGSVRIIQGNNRHDFAAAIELAELLRDMVDAEFMPLSSAEEFVCRFAVLHGMRHETVWLDESNNLEVHWDGNRQDATQVLESV